MEFQQVVRQRRMVRAFREDPLDPDVIERILANGNRAPSAGFTQGYGFLVLEADRERARFWQTMAAAGQKPEPAEMAAPLLVVPLASKAAYLDRYAEPDKGWTDRDEGRWPVPYWYIDTGFAALLMLLTAVDQGLGGCSSACRRRRSAPCGPPLVSPTTTSRSGCWPSAIRPRAGRPGRPGGGGVPWSRWLIGATGELTSHLPTMRPMTTRWPSAPEQLYWSDRASA
jgi:hypothetical protein